MTGKKSGRYRLQHSALGTCCYCGKRTYESRAEARRAARSLHHGDSRLNAYECPDAVLAGHANWWHIGHLNGMTKHGEYPRHSRPIATEKGCDTPRRDGRWN